MRIKKRHLNVKLVLGLPIFAMLMIRITATIIMMIIIIIIIVVVIVVII